MVVCVFGSWKRGRDERELEREREKIVKSKIKRSYLNKNIEKKNSKLHVYVTKTK